MVLEFLPESRKEWKWMKDDQGAYSKHLEATDENDLDLVISVFRVGIHSDNEEEDRSDRIGTYRGIRVARYDVCWNWRTLKVIVAILKFILWRTGSQCNSERTGVMWQKRDFPVTTRASVF